MTTNNDKKYGKTFFDIISEHPKPSFFILITIIAILLILILLKVPFKIGTFEMGNNNPIVHDTVVKIKTVTQFIDRPKILTKDKPTIKPAKEPLKSVSVKQTDSAISVQNQPANINTGTNNGIIGNNNDVKVNVSEIQRRLNNEFKQKLIYLILETIELKKIPDSFIVISAASGNNEAFTFATEILGFLKSNNLNVSNDIGQFQRAPPIKGVLIDEGSIGNKRCVEVQVGYK